MFFEMKTIYILLVVLFFSACDNIKSIRYLVRAGHRASEIEGETTSTPKNNYLISFTETKGTNGNTVFNALYTLPQDTTLFFLNLSYNMPENLGFEGELDSCTVDALFFESMADTLNNKYAIKRSFNFKKDGGFFKITSH